MEISSSAPAVAAASLTASTTAKAADGDYKVKSARTSQVKDADGDYKPLSSAGSTASTASSGVQAALTSLKLGG